MGCGCLDRMKGDHKMSSTAITEPIRLRYSQHDARFMIEPGDEDELIMRIEEVMQARRICDVLKPRFKNQFDHLKWSLGEWLRNHANKIQKAFLTLPDTGMLFLVVMSEKAYDEELEEELTDLELRVALDPECSQVSLDVQAVPKCSEDRYITLCNSYWILEYVMADAR